MNRSDQIIGLRIAFWLFTLMMLGCLVVMILQGIDRFQHGSYVDAGLALFGVIGPILAVRYFGTSLRTQMRDLRREHAVTYGQSMAPLAQPQPEPVSETTIATPIIIHMQADWRTIVSFIVMIVVVFAFFEGVLLFAGGEEYWMSGSNLFSLVFSLVGSLAFIVFLVRFLRQELVASDIGISLKQGFSTTKIRWSEARLFAVTGTYTPAPDLIRYALDGNGAIIRWWLYTKPPGWMTLKPVAPFAEYDRRMRALLSLVAAKTGLPLLDLR